jgi:signal transduction histidine kinase/HAMP domain-containing protein
VIRHVLVRGAIIAVLAAIVLDLVIGFYWYLPLRRITLTAREIASGSLDKKARVSGSRELAQLASALNDMRDSLASQIQTIAAQRGDLQTVIANLGEGLVALDAQARVVLMNSTAAAMLGADAAQAAGKPLSAVVRLSDVVDLSNHAFASRQTRQRQIEADIRSSRRTLDVHTTPLSSAGIAQLLILRDVTELVRTSAVKAEFVANASHELRTPLATLRAAVDNLQGLGPMDEAMSRRMHDILNRHVCRLENMTKDLLDLHLAETGKVKLRPEAIDVQRFGNWAIGAFSPRAQEKGVALNIEARALAPSAGETPAGEAPAAPGPVTAFRSDSKLLEMILQNLLDNAIKFTPAGGRVSGSLEILDGPLVMRISDTGCGIGKEDQVRVFERFFQADAARSGDSTVRGTGLGLAIVKHACERLGATIELQSERGKGTTVTVTVPPLAEA